MKIITLSPAELRRRNITPLGIIHPESALAHKYLDGLIGVEVGAASYQPFGLDALNVSTSDSQDRDFYQAIQLMVCGSYVEVDEYAEADALPFDDGSQDFVIASHVVEHLANPIKAFLEWQRVLKVGGYVYLIVPKREAPYGDQERCYTPRDYIFDAYDEDWTDADAYAKMFDRPAKDFDRPRGHIWVFNLNLIIDVIHICGLYENLNWKLIEAHDTDDKDKMGHMLILEQQ